MKAASAGLIAHLAGTSRTMAACVRITARDGTVRAFTDHDQTITIDISDGAGSVAYSPLYSFVRTALETTANVDEVDDMSATVFLESGALTKAEIIGGKWDKAALKIFMVNHATLANGAVILRRGFFGPVGIQDETANSELLGLVQVLQTEVSRVYSQSCPFHLGDTNCGVRLNPPAWAALTLYSLRQPKRANTGSVVRPSVFNDRHFKCVTAGTSGAAEPIWNTTIGGLTSDGTVVWETIRALTIQGAVNVVTDQKTFSITYTGDAPDALLTGGLLTFTAGANSGVALELRDWDLATKTIIAFRGFPFTITPGDTLTIAAGCDKLLATCRDTFDNVRRHGGDPQLPGEDAVFRTPDAKPV